MTYELQVHAAPQRLADAFGGTTVELRELSYGALTDAMRAGGDRGRASEGLLAASLHVDGQPVGLDALLSLPGRFSKAIGEALAECIRMHGIASTGDDDDTDTPAASLNSHEGAQHPKQ